MALEGPRLGRQAPALINPPPPPPQAATVLLLPSLFKTPALGWWVGLGDALEILEASNQVSTGAGVWLPPPWDI